jgi:hypothetical protein
MPITIEAERYQDRAGGLVAGVAAIVSRSGAGFPGRWGSGRFDGFDERRERMRCEKEYEKT